MKNEWRPIAEWDDFIAEWHVHYDKYFRGETRAPVASWVAFGSPGLAENEDEPGQDQEEWVFARISDREPIESQPVATFPLNVRRKTKEAACACVGQFMDNFWNEVELFSGEEWTDTDNGLDLMQDDLAQVQVKHLMRPWTPPFTHFCPVFLPPVPGTPYAHNARADGTQAEHLTTDGAEPPAKDAN